LEDDEDEGNGYEDEEGIVSKNDDGELKPSASR